MKKELEQFTECRIVIVNRTNYWQVKTKEDQTACQQQNSYPIALLEQIEKPWYRIILCVSAQDGIKCAEFVRSHKPDGVRIEHTEDTLVEIMNEASGKGDALRRACRYLGGTAEEAAFIGDFFNDIGALKAAGLSACVKNAPQEVKDCCDMVLSDCMDGAVAEFIERVQKII